MFVRILFLFICYVVFILEHSDLVQSLRKLLFINSNYWPTLWSLGNVVHAVRTQCKVWYVSDYLNPSFGVFLQVCCFITGFFYASCALSMWHI